VFIWLILLVVVNDVHDVVVHPTFFGCMDGFSCFASVSV
jgi:hypothetical protein